MMKIAITGATKGIGKEIYNYFMDYGYAVSNFSRENGWDIGDEGKRYALTKELQDYDVLINNAFSQNDFNAQFELLKAMHWVWHKQENKIIYNIGSRITDFDEFDNNLARQYAQAKKKQDNFIRKHSHGHPMLVNIRPGAVDTEFLVDPNIPKMSTRQFIGVFDFLWQNRKDLYIRDITFCEKTTLDAFDNVAH